MSVMPMYVYLFKCHFPATRTYPFVCSLFLICTYSFIGRLKFSIIVLVTKPPRCLDQLKCAVKIELEVQKLIVQWKG
jgi:hypothetical protein